MRKAYANSRWQDDAKALEIEVRQASGEKVNPNAEPDEDLKLMALNGLMNSDPERAIPMIEKVLQGSQSPKLKELHFTIQILHTALCHSARLVRVYLPLVRRSTISCHSAILLSQITNYERVRSWPQPGVIDPFTIAYAISSRAWPMIASTASLVPLPPPIVQTCGARVEPEAAAV